LNSAGLKAIEENVRMRKLRAERNGRGEFSALNSRVKFSGSEPE
jgi:hypothetical protein